MAHSAPAALLLLVAAVVATSGSPQTPGPPEVRVTHDELVRAMRRQAEAAYDLSATPNGVRLQVGVILELVRSAAQRDPERTPLRIDHRDWHQGFLEVTGLTPQTAPLFIRLAFDNREDQLVDYRRERVIARVVEGPEPRWAVNVKAGWPASPGAPAEYSYEDTTSDPHLRVIHERVNSYRILDFDDMIVYDDVHGIRGRATSGFLGFVFDVLGDGRAVRSRIAFAEDGLQVCRTTAKKALTLTKTVTVYPDGRVVPGVPKERDDLARISRRLERPSKIQYVPLDRSPLPAPGQ